MAYVYSTAVAILCKALTMVWVN